MKYQTLYPEIRDDLKVIQKTIFGMEDNFIEQKWSDLKESIHDLAKQCEAAEAERKQRDREERKSRKTSV